MHWLPRPTDLRECLKSALRDDDPDSRLDKLASLTAHQLDMVETIQLDNAISRTLQQANQRYPAVRLAMLSSCTVDHLLPAIRIAGIRRKIRFDILAGAFGQYRQEILDPASRLYSFGPDSVLLSLTAHDVVGDVPVSATAEDAEQRVSDALGELAALWRQVSQRSHATVIQQSFLDVGDTLFGNHDRLIPGAPRSMLFRLNDRLAAALSDQDVLFLDVAAAATREGTNAWFDPRQWLHGKIEIAPQVAPQYGELVARLISAQMGQSRKCIVFDLDNTLWGGVVGDVGVDGLVIGQGSALGEAFLALQSYARSLKDRGILLAVCSKNELATAELAFQNHPEMLLRRSDFAAFVANWVDKAENLRSIATQLNIGLDSLVFVDDNPVERARIREGLPMVAVPELPPDATDYVRCIADGGYFEAISFTTEDQTRADLYAANAQRTAVKEAAQSVDAFLRGLDMIVAFGAVTSVDLPRVTQLFNKTNQFNTTTLRLTRQEVSGFSEDPDNLVLKFRLIDRFGDNGIVSSIILCPDGEERDTFEIVNWVMSCRVFGRQLEDEIMNIVVETAMSRGVRHLRADLIPTPKNGVIRDLYSKLGFHRTGEHADSNAKSRWTLQLSTYVMRETFLNRKVTEND